MVNFDDLRTGVMALVLCGVMLGIGLLVLDGFSETAQSIGNNVQNVTIYTNGNTSLTYTDGVTCLSAQNATKFALTETTHFTCSPLGVLTAVGTTFNKTSIEFTYTYEYDSASTDTVQNVFDGVDDFANWFSTIVVIICAGLILTIVVTSFKREA